MAEYFGRGLFAAPPNLAKISGLSETGSTAQTSSVRQIQAGARGPGLASEARLRAEERSYGTVQPDSEARIRLAAGSAAGTFIKNTSSFTSHKNRVQVG